MSDNSKFDELLNLLGTGRWNIIHFGAVALCHVLIPLQLYSVVYIAPALNITCLPPLDHNVSTISEDSCSYERWAEDGVLEEERCTEWHFDNTTYTSTLTSEFELVCDRGYFRSTFQSLGMISSILCSIINGICADRFGRKVVVSVTQVVYIISCICITFIPNFSVILALRFITGIFSMDTIYTLAMEVCEVKRRSLVGVIIALPWSIGMMVTGLLAYLIRDWRYLQLACSIPNTLLLPVLFLINESPRWLIVRGHHHKALRVLHRAARINKVTLPEDDHLLHMMKEIQLEGTVKDTNSSTQLVSSEKKNPCKKIKIPDLVKTAKIRLVMAVLCFLNLINSLVYYGISLSGSNYSDNPFLYMAISGLMELPAYSITGPVIGRWGRKLPTFVVMFICGVVLICLTFIEIPWLVMTFAMVGKLTISCSFMIIYVYQAELLPTAVRVQGTSVTTIMARISASAAPFVANNLGFLVPWLPSVIFGVTSIAGSLSLLLIPETLGKNMPDMVEDLDQLWSKKKTVEDNSENRRGTGEETT